MVKASLCAVVDQQIWKKQMESRDRLLKWRRNACTVQKQILVKPKPVEEDAGVTV
jgi:hypothetical protein